MVPSLSMVLLVCRQLDRMVIRSDMAGCVTDFNDPYIDHVSHLSLSRLGYFQTHMLQLEYWILQCEATFPRLCSCGSYISFLRHTNVQNVNSISKRNVKNILQFKFGNTNVQPLHLINFCDTIKHVKWKKYRVCSFTFINIICVFLSCLLWKYFDLRSLQQL